MSHAMSKIQHLPSKAQEGALTRSDAPALEQKVAQRIEAVTRNITGSYFTSQFGLHYKFKRVGELIPNVEIVKSIIFVLLSLTSLSTLSLEIDNFKSGLACTDGKSFGWICHQTEEIYVTGQGSCTWNGQVKPCTWYGFEFDYKNNESDTVIKCDYKVSDSVADGNPKEILSESVDSGSFTFSLDGKEGHFYNPQYSIFSVRSADKSPLSNKTTCKVDDVEIFQFTINAHFPEAD